MLAIASLLVVFTLSVLIVRIGTHALNMTGLSLETARFQALSALSGAGFTTDESERAISTPARRRVITLLIRAGSLGIVTAVSTLVLGFVGDGDGGAPAWQKLALLIGGSAAVYALSQSASFDRLLTRVIRRGLGKYAELDLEDYAHLLHLRGEYRVTEVTVAEEGYLARGPLGGLHLRSEGILVLGVARGDQFHGAPASDFRLAPGDVVTLYGRSERLRELSERGHRDRDAHEAAVTEQEDVDRSERDRLPASMEEADGKIAPSETRAGRR